MTWRDLFERARENGASATGYYNDNIRVDTPDGPVIVRIPIRGAAMMDLRPWREDRVLAAVSAHVPQAPRVLHSSADPPFQVHEFIAGDLLNEIAPRGAAVPSHVLDDAVRLFSRLTRVPRLPDVPESWPADGDTTAFARRLSALTQHLYDTYRSEYADLFAALAIPAEPLAPVDGLWRRLSTRPFTCVHADVHRRNMIVGNGTTMFLDWELALWADPVYDLAVHLHKMRYLPDEQDTLVARWLSVMAPEHTTGWEHDLGAHLTHQQIKSAIVDSIRYSWLNSSGSWFRADLPRRQPESPEHQWRTGQTPVSRAANETPFV